MQIDVIDPADDQAFDRWFAVLDAHQQDQRPAEPGWLMHEQRALVLAGQRADGDERVFALAALHDDAVVGIARVDLPQHDNRHLAESLVIVHPRHRGRGVGRRLVEAVEQVAREHGRTTVIVSADSPVDADETSPARRFADLMGYPLSQIEARRDIPLPIPEALTRSLTASIGAHAADYEVHTWRDSVPEALVDGLARLYEGMSTDFPRADLALEAETWDVARVRHGERTTAEMDRTSFGAAAVHRTTGEMVAYTLVGAPRSAPTRVYQWDTFVLRAHRGHRLGTLVKLACLQHLAAHLPEARFVSTWNATENAPMIAINDALGAVVTAHLLVWQKHLPVT